MLPTTTITQADEATETLETGDHDHFSHIVYPADKVTEAIINGTPVTALCGHTWVPSRDPKKYPVCETCKDVYDHLHQDDTRKWDKGT